MTKTAKEKHTIETADHPEIESYLPLLPAAVRKMFYLIRRPCPKNDDPRFLELYGRAQEFLINEFRGGKLTPHLVKKHLPQRLMDYYTGEDVLIPVKADTNRKRIKRGLKPIYHNVEQLPPGYDRIDPRPIVSWMLQEEELESMNTTYLVIYIFCTDDSVDRAIVNACKKDFDPTVYDYEDKKSQNQIAHELGISSSQVQRRIAAIKQRFDSIRRK